MCASMFNLFYHLFHIFPPTKTINSQSRLYIYIYIHVGNDELNVEFMWFIR